MNISKRNLKEKLKKQTSIRRRINISERAERTKEKEYTSIFDKPLGKLFFRFLAIISILVTFISIGYLNKILYLEAYLLYIQCVLLMGYLSFLSINTFLNISISVKKEGVKLLEELGILGIVHVIFYIQYSYFLLEDPCFGIVLVFIFGFVMVVVNLLVVIKIIDYRKTAISKIDTFKVEKTSVAFIVIIVLIILSYPIYGVILSIKDISSDIFKSSLSTFIGLEIGLIWGSFIIKWLIDSIFYRKRNKNENIERV